MSETSCDNLYGENSDFMAKTEFLGHIFCGCFSQQSKNNN